MRLVNLRGELIEFVDGNTTILDNIPHLVCITNVASRLAITREEGRLYDIDSLEYIDVKEGNFKDVFFTRSQHKYEDYYRPEFYAITYDGNVYRGHIGEFDSTIYSWKLVGDNCKCIAKVTVSLLDTCDHLLTEDYDTGDMRYPHVSLNNGYITVRENRRIIVRMRGIIGAYATLDSNNNNIRMTIVYWGDDDKLAVETRYYDGSGNYLYNYEYVSIPELTKDDHPVLVSMDIFEQPYS